MGFVAIDALKVGMVLGDDLVDDNGRLLLPKGTVLNDVHLASLKSRGVAGVTVIEGDHDRDWDDPSDMDPGILKQSEEYLAPFFSCVDLGHPAMEELFQIGVLRIARRLASGWKPPDPSSLIQASDGHLQDLFFKEEGTPLDLVRHEVKLTSFPDIYFKISEVLNSPYSSANHIAEVVSKDTSLTFKLLKLVNSPFYGFPSKIDSISRAVAMVGGNELSTLALGISAIQVFKDIPPELMDMKEFWKHSIAVGTFARNLATHKPGLSGERFFVAGMLHEVGRLVLFKKLPYASSEALLYSLSNMLPLFEAERDVIGFDHSVVGSLLLKEWKLPASLETIVKYQHNPMAAPEPLEPSIIHMAHIMAVALKFALRGSLIVPALNEKAWEGLGLDADILRPVVKQSDVQINAILAAFFGGDE